MSLSKANHKKFKCANVAPFSFEAWPEELFMEVLRMLNPIDRVRWRSVGKAFSTMFKGDRFHVKNLVFSEDDMQPFILLHIGIDANGMPISEFFTERMEKGIIVHTGHLAAQSTIDSLDFFHQPFKPQHCVPLGCFLQLDYLKLDGSAIHPGALREFHHTHVRQLSLRWTHVTDEDLEDLRSCVRLEFVDVAGCDLVTESGIANLRTFVPQVNHTVPACLRMSGMSRATE